MKFTQLQIVKTCSYNWICVQVLFSIYWSKWERGEVSEVSLELADITFYG